MLTAAQIDRELAAYLPGRIGGLADQILVYIDLLLKWNRKVALTTVVDPVKIVRFHFGESLFATQCFSLNKSRLADVGSGAGFPGLPLAMAAPQLAVTLIESNRKKCAFLEEVIRVLNLPNAEAYRGRAESMAPISPAFEFVTARAFGHFEKLVSWAKTHLTPDGRVLLWLGEADARAVSSSQGWNWDAPRLIPGSSRRYVLVGSAIHL